MLLLLLLLACRHAPPTVVDTPGETPSESPVERLPLPGLQDVACAPDGCVALTASGLRRLPDTPVGLEIPAGVDTLRFTGTWELEGACPAGRCKWTTDLATVEGPTPVAARTYADSERDVAVDASAFAAFWRSIDPATTRIPFVPVVMGLDGRPLVLTRGSTGTSTLFKAGTMQPVAIPPSPASWPGWFALHPSGGEAYLLAWPSGVVRAFDPVTLQIRWVAELGGAAQGLFLVPGGRYLVAATGTGETDRLADWPLRPLVGDVTSDEWIREEPRPPADAVVVVDLAAHTRVARVPGRYRRLLVHDGTLIVVTDREIATLRDTPVARD